MGRPLPYVRVSMGRGQKANIAGIRGLERLKCGRVGTVTQHHI